jgi:hypothetical protein
MSGGITSGHRDPRQLVTTVNDRNDEMTTNTTDHESILNRSTEMQLMHEDLARAHRHSVSRRQSAASVSTVSSPPTGRTDGPSRPLCAPAVSSPPPSSARADIGIFG